MCSSTRSAIGRHSAASHQPSQCMQLAMADERGLGRRLLV